MRALNNGCVLAVMFVACGVATPVRAQTDLERPLVNASTAPSSSPFAFRTPLFAPASDCDQVIQQPAGPPPTPRHTGIKALVKGLVIDFKYLPARENLMWAGIGGGLALAVHPADDNVNRALVGSDFADKFFKAGEVLGELPTLLSSVTRRYGPHSIARDVRSVDPNVEIRHETGAPGWQRPELVPFWPCGGHVCICHSTRASSRMALCGSCLHVRVVRRDIPIAGQSSLAQ
jgi:hypothetical protein